MLAIFYLTFNVVGAFFSDLLAAGIDALTVLVDGALTDYGLNPVVHSLVINGVFAGVGSVLSFLPIIVVLFFFLSILEDTGYMDDFFLRPEQRTKARLTEPGGNVDWERFREEVLSPLTCGETVRYRRYNCHTQTVEAPKTIVPRALNIVEGVYSMRPELASAYDLSVFLSVSPKLQHIRIETRNGPDMQAMFFVLWIPLENSYFDALDVRSRCDLILESDV